MCAWSENAEIKDSVALNEVVVTGSKVIRSARNIPSTISVVNQQNIDNSGYSNVMPVLSQYVPGLFVTERGIAGYGVANGSAGAITIRGIGSTVGKAGDPLTNTQVLFLIDGHPQFMGLMGHHLADSYLTDNIERVEVIRGPASVLYGSNAMGGVVNLITKKQQQKGYFGSFDMAYGSYNTLRYSANSMMKSGKWNGVVSLEHEQTDGARTNSQYHNNSGYAKIGYALSDHFNLSGDLNLTKYKAYDPDTVGAPVNPAKWADISRGVTSLSLENRFQHSSGSMVLFWNFGNHHIYDGYHSRDHCSGFNLYQSFDLFQGNIIAGIDYENYGGFAENNSLNSFVQNLMGFPVRKSIHETAGYTSLQQDFFGRYLSVNVGIRYSENSVYGGEWIPQGGVSVRPSQFTVLKASVSKGFRSPTVKELYMFPPHNENLQPEKMMNYEVSWQQAWLQGRLSTELTTFIAKGTNLIRQVAMQYLNTGSFLNKGIELMGDYKVSERVRLTVNYSYLYMDTPVLAAPKHQLFGTLQYKPINNVTAGLSVQRIEDLYIQTTPAVTQNYTLVNLHAACKPYSFWEINLSVNNMLNQKYQINKGYPMPPTNVMVGMKFSIGKS
ncbi:MAG: TonB-dependent receptor [Bacteroidetes bacterium]|nr:TonB-dependent receptor [Bacteroidota bacterium]